MSVITVSRALSLARSRQSRRTRSVVKLAEKMWGDRFQVIVATHLNTECLHNHFVVNSVSFADGKHYHDNKANLRLLRHHSDELCREYALSVIEHPSGRKKPYALYQAEKQGRPTRDNVARQGG